MRFRNGLKPVRWSVIRFTEVEKDALNGKCIGDEADDLHQLSAPGTAKRKGLVDARQKPG
jgi:hypothetical protein